jgi:DNA-binding transcriptional ArsR family regulator
MPIDALSTTFAALADPTRRAILARLATGEHTVNELAKPFDMSLPAVSKHLRVLERAGLIARRRDAQRRPCRIEARRLKEVADWTERYRHIWEQRLDRLDKYLQEMKEKEKEKSHGRKQRRK